MQTEAEAPAREPLSLQRVTRRYRELTALEGVDLSIRQDEVLAVVGPSGCGKSTLLELMAGLQEPDEGTVSVAGATDAAGRRAACAYMPQRDLLLPWRDALANAALALECQGVPRADARRRAEPLFERFGLAEFEHARPAELSGGMRQRVAFLRTLLPRRRDGALVRLLEPGHQLEQRRLAAAGRAHDGQHLVRSHAQLDALEGRNPWVPARDVRERKRLRRGSLGLGLHRSLRRHYPTGSKGQRRSPRRYLSPRPRAPPLSGHPD